MKMKCCNKNDPIFFTQIDQDEDVIITIPHDEDCSFCITEHSLEEYLNNFTSVKMEFSFYDENNLKHDISLTYDQMRELTSSPSILKILNSSRRNSVKHSQYIKQKIISSSTLINNIDIWLCMLSKKYMESNHKLIVDSGLKDNIDIYGGNIFNSDEKEIVRNIPHPSDGTTLGSKLQNKLNSSIESGNPVCLTHEILPIVREYLNKHYQSRKHGNSKFCKDVAMKKFKGKK